MQKRIIKTGLWLLLLTVVAILGNIGNHALEVFYIANVGPDQVNDYTDSYYWVDNYDNLKMGMYIIHAVIMILIVIPIFNLWKKPINTIAKTTIEEVLSFGTEDEEEKNK